LLPSRAGSRGNLYDFIRVVDPFDHCLPVILTSREDQLPDNFVQSRRADGLDSRNKTGG
jgi:hypothetical protein